MRNAMLFITVLITAGVVICSAGTQGVINPIPTVVDGTTQGDFMDWNCWEGFRPIDDPTDVIDTLWWTGNIEYHIFGTQSISWDPDLPEIGGVVMEIKYGLWNSPQVGLAVSVNGNPVGVCMANYGYISPGPKYGRAHISDYIVAGPDLIEIVASYGGEAVIGYVATAVWVDGDNLAGEVEDTFKPMDFELIGPAPNPFNPTTVIGFQLPNAGKVNLAIYDISGRQVAELVNGWRDAGMHEVTFDASDLASGIYLYRLQAGEFSGVGKMVLVK
ncbi:hypothetical protein CEE37_01895 [candidate division LCP-89 bacterium B3_LCP]|uniref:Secretion system C-terminal sorting domain-containing protein n=1 Tax=candidate division LCP-89 bacterium B3_LCP TaxID=2012998 RepID=A0A532V5J3_UNCL8|nr:MAG: hypothetical protein CEE37_01895 [candidate division LCP-89 bacterium B3_LCP]